MNKTLSGIIFLLFGLSLLYDSMSVLLGYSSDSNIKAILFLLLGLSSCIYGFKQIKHGKQSKQEKQSYE